jgi:hypothetical protein
LIMADRSRLEWDGARIWEAGAQGGARNGA